jgi:hypothetical protein
MKLYDNGRLTVADAAMQAQFTNEDLFPKRGTALTFTVNERSHMVRGVQGEAAVIRLNGDPADLYTQITSGDVIEVTASTEGEAGAQELGKLPELAEQLHVYVNGSKISLPKTAEVNGQRENEYYKIQEGDVIKVQNCYTVAQVAEFLDVPLGGYIRVNDTPARQDTKVYENFSVSWDMDADAGRSVEEIYPESEEEPASEGNAEHSLEEHTTADAGQEATTEIKVMANGQLVTLSGKTSYVFVDIFDYIDFDLTDAKGRTIMTSLNGSNAEYMAQLKDGDVIEIYWKENGKTS